MDEKKKIYKRTSLVREWQIFIRAVRLKTTLEIDIEMFNYWREVASPVYVDQTRNIDVNNDGDIQGVFCIFGYVEENDCITDFWKVEGKYFCKQSNEKQK